MFRCLPLVIGTGLLLLALTAAMEVQALPAERWPESIEGGQLVYRDKETGNYQRAVLQQSQVELDIAGMIATVRLEQTFRNDSDQWVEGVYAFPLPETAAVRHMELVVGERVIRSEVREKQAAKEIYRKATAAGKKASLVEQQRPNLFTNRVANIAPGETVAVRLEYLQLAAYRHGVFSLRFPMTITARYIPGTAQDAAHGDTLRADPYHGWATPTDQVPDADAVTPPHWPAGLAKNGPLNPISISGRITMGLPMQRVESTYHGITLQRDGTDYAFTLAGDTAEMDRDFELRWQPVTGREPEAALFTETVGDERFALVMVMPPTLAGAAGSAQSIDRPREMVFVIDTSGSMGGASIEQARESLNFALSRLGPEDRFNIIEFASSPRALYSTPVPATRHHLERAREFVRLLRALGGTEMSSALALALRNGAAPEDGALQQVVFITDGAVGNETALFEQISRDLGDRRLFTVGIGAAPNSWFMRKAAQFGRGTFTYVGRQDDVGTKMRELFAQLEAPVATDLALRWSGDGQVETFPGRMPDLYLGEPLLVSAWLGKSTAASGELQVSGLLAGSSWQRDLQYESGSPGQAGRAEGVATLWARAKIADLLDQQVTGRPEQEVRNAVLDVALRHRLASPYTSFLAVEQRVSRPGSEALASRAVPNSQPQGQSPQPYAWPATATSGPGSALLGSLLLFIALMTVVMRRPEGEHALVR